MVFNIIFKFILKNSLPPSVNASHVLTAAHNDQQLHWPSDCCVEALQIKNLIKIQKKSQNLGAIQKAGARGAHRGNDDDASFAALEALHRVNDQVLVFVQHLAQQFPLNLKFKSENFFLFLILNIC